MNKFKYKIYFAGGTTTEGKIDSEMERNDFADFLLSKNILI